MVLTGTEVKAAKDGQDPAQGGLLLRVQANEAWLVNAHIGQYSHGNRENHPPDPQPEAPAAPARDRKAPRAIIREKGLSLIPTKMYLKGGRIKCEFAVAKGQETAR